MELGIPYTLIGPDGTRAVFGNSDDAQADPDWVGFLDPDNGIVGLDGTDVRESADDLVEQDGGVHGPFYEGRRPVLPHVVINPDLHGAAREAAIRKLKRAGRALRDDAVLRWTPSDVGLELELALRRQGKPTESGRHPRTVQLPMVSADPAKRASAESQLTITPGVAAGIIGYTSPYSSPYGTELGVTGADSVENLGDVEAIPRFRIDGPITNPELLNNTTGKSIKLVYTLAAGEFLEVDAGRKTVLLGGSASRFSAVVFPDTKWWRLVPGLNDVRLLAAAFSAGAALTVYWRHAFE